MVGWRRLLKWFGRTAERFRSNAKGQIAVVFALASVAVVVGVGSGIDLSRAYFARQKLSEIATLTCQFSTRPSVVSTANSTNNASSGFQTYLDTVNNYAASALTTQGWNLAAPTGASGNAKYFTATAATGTSSSSGGTAPTNGVTQMSANVPTTFLNIAAVGQIPVSTRVGCQTASTTPQGVDNTYVLREGFETGCATFCYTLPTGATGTTTTPKSTFPSSPAYTGSGGFQFYVMGYCLEVDSVGLISSTVPEGTHSAELDCDNGSNSAGNSSISAKVYLPVGNYELRYNYRSREPYPNYDPTYICGTTAGDVSWANDTASGKGARSNQLNVYLDINVNGTAPLHTTSDGAQQLAGSNLIDVCVYSYAWVERSVKITVTTPAYYWLSFAADGLNNSFGSQLDNLRFCNETCPGTLDDAFPSAFTAGKVLFEDTFDTPAYITTALTRYTSTLGNLNLSLGTSGASSGWPAQTASGWATAPINQINYTTNGAFQGTQHISLDGSGGTSTNRLISRSFILDPGYYSVSYYYMSLMDFPSGVSSCVAAPASGQVYPAAATLNGTARYSLLTTRTSFNTNLLGVFMSNGQLVSTPIGGGLLASTTSYNNPDGTVTTTPKVQPDAVNWQSYDSTAVNPVIDSCNYADNYAWVTRNVSIKINKPGIYWLTFSANGSAADGFGAAIDDVKLSVLGSPYMASPPTNPLVSIPVPSPQPDTIYSNSSQFTGFYIIADPFAPPAVSQ